MWNGDTSHSWRFHIGQHPFNEWLEIKAAPKDGKQSSFNNRQFPVDLPITKMNAAYVQLFGTSGNIIYWVTTKMSVKYYILFGNLTYSLLFLWSLGM